MSDTQVQHLLDLLRANHPSARDALFQHTFERLQHLAACLFRRQADLRSLNDTDDVLQRALVRLNRALQTVQPTDARTFFGLAARQVRWVLRDMAAELARCQAVRYTSGATVENTDGREAPATTGEPGGLLEWTEFHEKIEQLPDEERETVDLLLYQGMSQLEAAEVLGISARTVKRRWQNARLLLHKALHGQFPDLG